MYAKLIACTVDPTFREPFSIAQTAWSEGSDSKGFKSQFGGWEVEYDRAIIVSYWKDEKSLSAFMKERHDEIATKSMQVQTYRECTIIHLRELSHIVGNKEFENSKPVVLRMTDCRVFPEKSQHFFDVQNSIWNPGMRMCEGFCGGIFWSHDQESHRYIITTLWSTIDKHEHYVQQTLPKLKIASNLSRTVSAVQSVTVVLQENWEFAAT